MVDVLIAIDQGTTNTKAVAVEFSGTVLAKASIPVGVTCPRPGMVEQDPLALWHSVRSAVDLCLRQIGKARLAGLALSTQRESVVAWDRSDGRPLGPVLSWQDARTSTDVERVRNDAATKLVRRRTGLFLDSMFSAPKMAWLARHTAGAADLAIGTIDSWLLWNLAGQHVTEAGNASRTLLFDIERLAWDNDLIDLFNVPASALPRVARSDGPFGPVTAPGLPHVPVLAVLADSHAALDGHRLTNGAVVKATYGTGSSVMRIWPSAEVVDTGVATTLVSLTSRPTYALEGNIRYSGAALDWAARILGLASGAELGTLAESTADSGGLVLVPAFGGFGAPYWDDRAVAALFNLGVSTTREQITRASFEAVVHEVADVIEAMSPCGSAPPTAVFADGGASTSTLLMQLQADMTGIEVASLAAELSALGAAALAARKLGWPDLPTADERPHFLPAMPPAERLEHRAAWHAALTRLRGTAPAPTPTTASVPIGDDSE